MNVPANEIAMVLSKRERYIAIGVGTVVVLLMLDLIVVSPYLTRRAEIAKEMDDTTADIHKADILFLQQKRLRKLWNEMNANGLNNTPSDAESQLQLALDEWSQECGVNVSSLKYERSAAEGKFLRISFHLTGTGPLSTMANLLWRLETTSMPLRVNEIQITPRKEGQDNLQLQLAISTLCRIPDSDLPDKNGHMRTANGYSSARGEGL